MFFDRNFFMQTNAPDYNDPFNRRNARNHKNTDPYLYNCAGYALNCFSWYCPVEQFDYYTVWGSEDETERERLTDEFVQQILKDFPSVRVIDSISDLHDNEYAMAFRVGEDDFHFIKRGDNGVWYEKCGATAYIERKTKEDVFSDAWGPFDEYNGPLVLMANKKVA